jgi:hypothetical protein
MIKLKVLHVITKTSNILKLQKALKKLIIIKYLISINDFDEKKIPS